MIPATPSPGQGAEVDPPVSSATAHPADAALAYAARGWPVFPCHTAGPGGACSCRTDGCTSPGKHPRVPGGLRAATTDPSTIGAWWARWPAANVAVRTGAVSGLVVIDVDPPHGGDASLRRLGDRHGELPATAVVRTGSGGLHLYLAHPGGRVPNDTGTRLGPGIDVRGDGGYVIAPPSRHRSGALYQWTATADEVPPMPGWMLDQLRPTVRPPLPPPAWPDGPPGRVGAWARAALDGELARVKAAVAGCRNETLNRAAFSLGQLVGAGALDAAEVEVHLLAAATDIGLGEREARRTIGSGLVAGTRHPRLPAGSGPAADCDPWLLAVVERAARAACRTSGARLPETRPSRGAEVA
ncbi:MAG: bifunctional DNA primase/polymerase [Actinomycetota bacterium]